ncbi:hypothetical protein ABGB07_03825 [Micromonosporaceae bacterium B7E4]
MTRRTRIALFVAAGIATFAIVGAGIGLIVAETSGARATAVAATSNPNAIECANIDRAYQAWSIGRLRDMYEYEAAAEPHLLDEIEDQKALLQAVSGYPDQASKELATAVATFGVELALLNTEVVIAGNASLDQASVVTDAQKALRAAYSKWKAATCG